MTIGAIGGLYWCFLFLPVYIDHWEVTDAVNAAFNAYGIVNDHIMRSELEAKLREAKFTTHLEFDQMGNEVEKPGLAVTDVNPNIEVDEVNRTLAVTYRYDRTIHFIPSQKIRVLHFVAQKKGKFPH
jgi:hypothetical protein